MAFLRPTRFRLLLVGLCFALAAAEALTRLSIGSDAPSLLSHPSRYGDPLCDDSYWALQNRLASTQTVTTPLTRHPTLGWTLDPATTNVLGGAEQPEVWSTTAPRLGLFGDSFVQGTTPVAQRLGVQLQNRHGSVQVLSFAVGGYGLDQTILSLAAHLPDLAGGDAIIGVMLTDIDRCILNFRDAPKPRFSIDNGALVLQLDHMSQQPKPPISMIYSWLKNGALNQVIAALDLKKPDCRQPEKRALTQALIARAARDCTRHNVRCSVLLMPHKEAYQTSPGWRSEVLTLAAKSNGLAVIDMGQRWPKEGLNLNAVYQVDRHPSAVANRVMATAILDHLRP